MATTVLGALVMPVLVEVFTTALGGPATTVLAGHVTADLEVLAEAVRQAAPRFNAISICAPVEAEVMAAIRSIKRYSLKCRIII